MSSSPSTPPRRMHASHLHQRSVSRTPSFPTSPPSNRSSPVYSLMRDSPKHPRNRLADSVASASEFVGRRGFNFGKKGDRGKDGGVRRIVVLTVIAIGLLVLAERSWNGEESMFRSGRKMDDFAGLRSMEVTDETRIEKALNYDGTYNQRHKGLSEEEELKSRPEEPVDRWIKVSRPAPARLDNPSRPSPEIAIVPPPYTFDPSQRFIFVGWMGEQETKAQAHLYQLGLLALATNRTLVLPGVRKSRFGSCYLQNDFTLYYAADTFDRFGIPYITASDFTSWLEQNEETPTAQMVSFARGESVSLTDLDATPRHFCLDSWRLDWTQQEQRAFFISTSDWKSPEVRTKYGEEVVKGLLEQSQPSVIVLQYNLRFPFLTPDSIATLSPYHFPPPRPYSYFPYSSHWLDLGHAISDQLSPFVAVHWRTETLEVDRIATCGVSLVQELRRIRKEHPAINTLYLATDYPLDLIRNGGHLPKSVVANSGTMGKTLTPAHHDAMRAFLSLLEGETDDDSFHLTTFHEESRLVQLPSEVGSVENLDPAIAGLVDKVVLSNAELFYAGLPVSEDKVSGCAKLSQFTTQVITGRKEVLAKAASEDEDTRLWNDVGHFSITGREVNR